MSAPRQYAAIVALLAANDVADDATRAKQDAHDALELKHREAGRALGAKRDALQAELRANAAARRALYAEKAARIAENQREPIYRTGES